MNIRIPTIGSRGDVQPFIALAQGLVRAGHQVTILTHPVMCNLVETHGIPFTPIGPDVDMDEVSALVRKRSRNPWAGLIQTMRFAFDMLERSHEDIMAACQGADLVVISASGAAGKNEAELLGIPYASVNLMPWGIPYTEPGRPLTKRILYGAIDALAAAVTTRPLNNLRRRQGLPPVGPEGLTSPGLDLIPIIPPLSAPTTPATSITEREAPANHSPLPVSVKYVGRKVVKEENSSARKVITAAIGSRIGRTFR